MQVTAEYSPNIWKPCCGGCLKEEWRGADKRLKDGRNLEKTKSTLLGRGEGAAQVHEFPSDSTEQSTQVSFSQPDCS